MNHFCRTIMPPKRPPPKITERVSRAAAPAQTPQPAPPAPSPPAKEEEDLPPRLVLEVCPASSEIVAGPHEARLHRASFIKLGIKPGAFVRITEDNSEADSDADGDSNAAAKKDNRKRRPRDSIVCQAFVATGSSASMPSDGIAVSEAATRLIGRKGADCFVEPCGAVADAASVRVSASVEGSAAQSSLAALCSFEDRLLAHFAAAAGTGVVCVGQPYVIDVAGVRVSGRVTEVRAHSASYSSSSSSASAKAKAAGSARGFGLIVPTTTLSATLTECDGDAEADAAENPQSAVTAEGAVGANATELPPHTLFVGDHGVGKTHAVEALVASVLSSSSSLLDISKHRVDITLEHVGTGNANAIVSAADGIRRLIQRAVAAALDAARPVVIVLDDVDILFAAAQTPREAFALQSVLSEAFALADGNGCAARIIVVASCSSAEKVPPMLLARFGAVRHLHVPSGAEARALVLRSMLDPSDPSGYAADVSEEAIVRVAADSHGFNQLDLRKLCRVALSVAFNRTGRPTIFNEDLIAASRRVRPSVLSTLEVGIPNVRWSDIGGSDEAKAVLQECVAWCIGQQQSIFAHLGLPPPKGVLLYGPPGCSKTMLAKALARESGMNFVSVKGPEVFSKWVGDSEKAVRDVFRQARAAAPCVVFIDELDGMCGHRGGGGVSDRVISQLLTELDGLPAASSSATDSIIFVAATNRPENIDAAVLRPGRIDRKVFVGLPNAAERESIAKLHLSKVPRDEALVTPAIVAARTEGYTGAETVAVCKEASFQALARSINADRLEGSDLEAAFVKVRPRISEQEVDWYRKWGAERSS